MASKYLNLGCGDIYVKNSDWVNLDWYPHSDYVVKANLLAKLDFEDDTFSAVYTSHFVEHIPRENLDFFLRECLRVLKPDGIIRIVVPDLENIVREYLQNLDSGALEKAEFNSIELLDQCVRSRSGGLMASWRGRQDLSQMLREYVSDRTGYIYKNPVNPRGIGQTKLRLRNLKISKIRIQWVYCRFLTRLMPNWFIVNHVNFTNTGELHKWVYDKNSLTKHLSSAGFRRIRSHTANSSQIKDFPFVPLDLDQSLRIRKGAESMYIEALK